MIDSLQENSKTSSSINLKTSTISAKSALEIALAISVSILVIEILGGLKFGSSALIADALHIFTDIFAIGFSLIALTVSNRPPTSSLTYGYHRLEVFASLTNGISLFLIAALIAIGAYERFLNPSPVYVFGTVIVATIALCANVLSRKIISQQTKTMKELEETEDENILSVSAHVWGDALASAAVIFGALASFFTGKYFFDPLAAIVIGVLVLRSAATTTWGGLSIMLERSPLKQMPLVESELEKVEGVSDVHDLHIWKICSHVTVATLHACLNDEGKSKRNETMNALEQKLTSDFGVQHATIQLEEVCCLPRHGHSETDSNKSAQAK